MGSIPWAFEFARRSGNVPISIFVRPGLNGTRKIVDCLATLIHENNHRIREMSLVRIDDETIRSMDAYPILENLLISREHQRDAWYPFVVKLVAPKLKSVSLISCLFDADSGPFHNLLELKISIKPSHRVVDQLNRVLLHMPNIEKLLLWQDLGETSFSFPLLNSGIQPAILPKLHHIEVRGWDIGMIYKILQVITYGPERTLLISPELYYGVDELLSLFTSVLSHATDTPIRHLYLSINPSSLMGLWIKAWRGDLECSSPDIGLATPLCTRELFMSRVEVAFDTVGLLDELLRRINYQDLQILTLDIAELLPISTWVRLFGTLSSLALIDLPWGEQKLFGALIDGIPTHSENADDSASSATAVLPFQALKEIKISQRFGPYSEEDMDFMLKCLRKRSDLGMGLKKLIFHFRDDSESDLKVQLNAFKEVVEVEYEYDNCDD